MRTQRDEIQVEESAEVRFNTAKHVGRARASVPPTLSSQKPKLRTSRSKIRKRKRMQVLSSTMNVWFQLSSIGFLAGCLEFYQGDILCRSSERKRTRLSRNQVDFVSLASASRLRPHARVRACQHTYTHNTRIHIVQSICTFLEIKY